MIITWHYGSITKQTKYIKNIFQYIYIENDIINNNFFMIHIFIDHTL